MTGYDKRCVLLADRHHGLRDSVRGLLESVFETVFMVATPASLLVGLGQLKPAIVVIDVSLAEGDIKGLLSQVRKRAPDTRVMMLTVHDEAPVTTAMLLAGADAVVLKRCLGSDLLDAVDALRVGERYISPGLAR